MITNIEVNKIYPHPNNPRKDLGDITELAESIKSRGIMQNLTVVERPNEDGGPLDETGYIGDYTVIIGHRRLAAAKLAGITNVPCVIAKMDEKEQVSTMLLENMQRSDLTVIEQAQGFQMMLDLGETTQTITEKTGFSETTVRKRLFVASLDVKKSKNAYEKGATLDDYMKLQKLTNEKKRNKVLESLGTNNFDYALQTAISEELKDRIAPQITKQIEVFSKPTDKQSWELKGYASCWNMRCSFEDYEKTGKLSFKIPIKWKPDEYLYHISSNSIEIYKQQENFKAEKKMSELPPAEQEERREKRRKYKELKEMGETTYQLRMDFVKSFSQKSALNGVQFEALAEFAFASVCLGNELNFRYYASLEDLQVEDAWQMNYFQKKEIMKKGKAPAAKILLMSLYSTFLDSAENTYFYGAETVAEKRGYHKKNGKLDAIYDCLCALGYQMSDEERYLRDGTHEMFVHDNEDKQKG